ITGPVEWSVRVGVYGEWGTGKTSVLNFVGGLASTDGHIVVLFNPWEYGSREGMWRAFVFGVLRAIEVQLGIPGLSRKAKAKDLGAKTTALIGKVAGSAAGLISDKAGDTVEEGIGLLKGFLGFGEEDFKNLRAILKDRRVLVLIDDLDRTSPGLVPEILFALKEVMDIPGFAFVCAFDPAVVGDVLGKFHPGFGNGLKFLEKIIDYPRWLPPPSATGMRALAHTDIARYCPYVPLAAMDEVVPLLPQNPRVLRQFIRLLALLKPQIDRHYERELGWPMILGANVLKILYPHIAQEFFSDESVWARIAGARVMGAMEKKDEDKVGKLLTERLNKAVVRLGIELKPDDRERILNVLRRIAEAAVWWTPGYRSVGYQIHVAEAPRAVTFKEYDGFLVWWKKKPTAGSAAAWMARHAEKVGRSEDEVYREVLDVTLRARDSELNRATNAAIDSEVRALLAEADRFLTLVEQLVLDLGGDKSGGMRVGEDAAKEIIGSIPKYLSWTKKREYRALHRREKDFLRRLVLAWSGDVKPLTNILQPSARMPERLHGKEVVALRKELRALVLLRLARQVLAEFCEAGVVARIVGREQDTYASGCLLLDAKGPLWKGLRKEALGVLARAPNEVNIQLNAFELLEWFDYKVCREAGLPETQAATAILSNGSLCRALWKAATVNPLNLACVDHLRGLPERVKRLGVELPLPRWWRRALKELGTESEEPAAASPVDSVAAAEGNGAAPSVANPAGEMPVSSPGGAR
ncbi:MAG: P-loop NTPase fold protein, partial [bacterium]